MLRTALLLSVLVPLSARAQEGERVAYDGHGFFLAPSAGTTTQAFTTLRPVARSEAAPSMTAMIEYAEAPLLLYDADDTPASGLLDDVLAVNVAGWAPLHERVMVGFSAPVVLTSRTAGDAMGPAMGDVRMVVPITVLAPNAEGTAFGLAVIPFFDFPVGTPGRWMGSSKLAAGGMLAASVDTSGLSLAANFGGASRGEQIVGNLSGGSFLLASVAAGYALSDRFGVNVEASVRPVLGESVPAGAESPAELFGSLRAAGPMNSIWTLGGATGLTGGAGAAVYRVFLGFSWSGQGPEAPASEG